MTLEEASRRALAAAQAGDLDALARALEARRQSIDAGQVPTPEAIEAGEQTVRRLRELILHAGLESSRLSQIHTGFARTVAPTPNIDYRG